MRLSWDSYFMVLAKMAASRSTCLSRPTGAVIVQDKQVLATGYNGSLPNQPHCIDSGVCFRRSQNVGEEVKYDTCLSSHAEANAIALAAKQGIPLEGSTIYCTLQPCFICSKLIVMSGIKRVVFELAYESPLKERDALWGSVLTSSGIEVDSLVLSDVELGYSKSLLSDYTSKRKC